jgi:hypothetical protein
MVRMKVFEIWKSINELLFKKAKFSAVLLVILAVLTISCAQIWNWSSTKNSKTVSNCKDIENYEVSFI